MTARLPIVAVVGSGDDEHADLAEAAGRAVARLGCHLLTGGHGGVMRGAARAFVGEPGRRGVSIGVLLAGREPNEFVELPIRTHLPLSGERGTEPMSRNHVNVLSADALVALPGGAGTLSELDLAARYGRPVVLFLGGGPVGGLDAAGIGRRLGRGIAAARDAGELRAALSAIIRG